MELILLLFAGNYYLLFKLGSKAASFINLIRSEIICITFC